MIRFVTLLVAAAILQGCTSFPAANIPAVQDLTPIKPVSESRKLYFESIQSKLENQSIGQMKVGTACINESELRWSNNPAVDPTFRDAIRSEIVNLGFNMATDTFDLKNQQEAEVLLGAKVTNIAANVCSSVDGTKGVAVVDIVWEVFDKDTRQSYKFNTSGKGSIAEFDKKGGIDLYTNSIVASLRNLLGTEEFSKLLSK